MVCGITLTLLVAEEVGGRILYISTDYVFDGNSPPYTVADVPKPLNKYGLTKLQGERAVVEADPGRGLWVKGLWNSP